MELIGVDFLILYNDDWYYRDEEVRANVPTDDCPTHIIKDYNNYLNKYYFLNEDLTYEEFRDKKLKIFDIPRFVKMRRRIGYTDEKIKEEIKEIFSKEEIKEHNILMLISKNKTSIGQQK